MEQSVESKTGTRALIETGVFTALYVVVLAVFGQLGALVPILQVLGPLYIPFVCGVPFMLFAARVKTFGQITIMGVLAAALVFLTGQSWVMLVLAAVLAPAADLIAKAGDYRRFTFTLVAYVVFSEMLIGMVVPLFFLRQSFISRIGKRHDSAWVDTLVNLTPPWMFWVMIVMIAVGAVGGAFLGRALTRKHFRPAGLA
ncbi:MAG: MptD family putative ECF transporter S component [Bifidobacteriaceae bacterium]|jgi:energy-coupling factor transport system substrate-specific component|nr:MptD family putative ECF transporter S component [Bifidobacteriaceae bacterium]